MVALKSGDIDSFVARPDPSRAIVLVFGPDAGLVSERVDAIIRASVDDTNDPFALVRLDGDTLASDPARLIDEATTVPLFGGRRAIRVRAGSRNIVPAVEGVLAARLSDCRIVIEAGDLKRGAALRNVCERAKTAVAIPCYADAARDIARLIDEELRAANLTISPEAREALVLLLGGDRRASRAELRKLTLYAHGEERIEIDDVMAVVADASALGLEALVDAAFAGKIVDLEREFAKASVAGTSAVSIVGTALRHVERLHALRLEVEGRHVGFRRGREPAGDSLPPQAAGRSGAEELDLRPAREGDGDAGRSLARCAAAIGLVGDDRAARADDNREKRRAARVGRGQPRRPRRSATSVSIKTKLFGISVMPFTSPVKAHR